MILLARVTTIHIVDIGFIRFYKYEQIHILKSQRYFKTQLVNWRKELPQLLDGEQGMFM
jgi:hypothetical protein